MNGGTHATLFDPATNQVTQRQSAREHVLRRADDPARRPGAGRRRHRRSSAAACNTVYRFDPTPRRGPQQDPMNKGRWYPAVAEVPSGQAVLLGGHDENVKNNLDVEVYTPGSPPEALVSTTWATTPRPTCSRTASCSSPHPCATRCSTRAKWTWTSLQEPAVPAVPVPGRRVAAGPAVGLVQGDDHRRQGRVRRNGAGRAPRCSTRQQPEPGWTRPRRCRSRART